MENGTLNITHENNYNSSEYEDEYSEWIPDPYRTQIEYVYFYALGLVVWSGLVLNTLTTVCFLTSKLLKRSTTGNYLIALSSADSIFLLGDLLRWLNLYIADNPYTGLTFHDDSHTWCKLTFYLRYFGKLTSAWLTVAITVERYISVTFPFKAGNISTKKNTRIIIICIYILCAALTSFPFWTIGLEFLVDEYGDWSWCAFVDQHQYNHWNWTINWAGSLFVPCVILFAATAMIVMKLSQMSRKRQNLVGGSKMKHIERQLTVMLVVVVVAFLCLRLPYTICYYLFTFKKHIWGHVTPYIYNVTWTLFKLTDVVASSNYAINFYLYCLAGSAFRGQFLALICCRTKELKSGKTFNTSTANTTFTAAVATTNKSSPAVNGKY